MLANTKPLPVLFSHKCCDAAHALHVELSPHFLRQDMKLEIDPFSVGEDVMVKMQRLQIHGLVFHCTPASLKSAPCTLERETAKRIGCAVMVLSDGESPPSELKNRLYAKISEKSFTERAKLFNTLAGEMKPRAETHAVLEWLKQAARTVEEREAGCSWLFEQESQSLAEFLEQIASIHRGEAEDNIVCRILAGVLAATELPTAISHLKDWRKVSSHPNAIYGIEKALERLECRE
jgi:hypothetical protein